MINSENPKNLLKQNNTQKPELTIKDKLGLSTLVVSVLVFCFLMVIYVFPPANAPSDIFIRVNKGDTVGLVADKLFEKKLIKSKASFKIITRLLGGDKRLQTGTYFFKKPLSVINISFRLANHSLGYSPLKITVFEGASNKKIAQALVQKIPNFDQAGFIARTANLEGRLFPDTYFLSPFDTPSDIIFEMNQNFENKILSLVEEIKKTGKSFDEILIMASIIDREAKTPSDKRIVSGILWKRLAAGMPLQVDATFEYYLGRTTFALTKSDLKSESPYNTYNRKGLPPTPIGNPGWEAILAAINPSDSPYWYYLSDRDGKMHFAKNFDEHKRNRVNVGI